MKTSFITIFFENGDVFVWQGITCSEVQIYELIVICDWEICDLLKAN